MFAPFNKVGGSTLLGCHTLLSREKQRLSIGEWITADIDMESLVAPAGARSVCQISDLPAFVQPMFGNRLLQELLRVRRAQRGAMAATTHFGFAHRHPVWTGLALTLSNLQWRLSLRTPINLEGSFSDVNGPERRYTRARRRRLPRADSKVGRSDGGAAAPRIPLYIVFPTKSLPSCDAVSGHSWMLDPASHDEKKRLALMPTPP